MARRRSPSNLGLLFDWHAEQAHQTTMHLDRPFDVAPDAGTTFSGPALAETVRELANRLGAAGLRHGDRLAIVKDNHYDMLLLAAAAARLGAVPVLIAPTNSVATIRALVEKCGPSVLVAGSGVLARAAAEDVTLAGSGTAVVAIGAATEGTVRLDDLAGAPRVPARPRWDDEPMIVTHTSGTTGVPKLVVHSANSSLGSFAFRVESQRLPFLTSRREDVVASCISFAHNRTLSWTASQFTLAPEKLVILSDPGLDNVTRVLTEHRATSVEAMPNTFQRWEELADTRPELFADVKRFISAFDAVHPRTVRKFLGTSRRRFPVWAWGLGQSEIAGIFANVITRRAVRPGKKNTTDATTVGWPTLVRVKVVDPGTGRRLPRGEPGLLMVATKSRCLSYLGEEDRHRAKVVGDWWNSGDLGERLTFGRLRLIDREVDLIPGTSCIELESTLLDRLPHASEVVVLGVPDGPPVPVVCMRDDRLDDHEWRRATAGLPELGKPLVVPWDDVPRTATWKVRRAQLREQLLGTTGALGSGQWT
ncbi:Acyl-CoA synthetase (AMP-forming)/AMP-acid ligase II [Amycolatopsis xylanica]|uniref:Acyl-CoA synthetase (AMP-forming)/AMP-acid ligase II n=1 Tax=Amycolatopsis xylanica TaxID=589385 RepID=A0A1H3T8M0_9PSEU|nr:class I adenylate-forming enzyme family protein [Amycolatopsis xylanica]SDZ46683.1 Acyl-CoA synthetase (AMP-forming)/AMP-acid ligase II [Amycolatopsis xylanica]